MAAVVLLLLSLASLAFPATCPVQTWDHTAPLEGALASTDCRLTDHIPGRNETNVARQFVLDVAEKGIYTIELASTDFDTILLLTDARFQPIGSNDDTTRNDSRVTAHLSPEIYYVFVIARGGSGSFRLQASVAIQSGCQIREIEGGEFSANVTSSLGASSCRLLDVLAPSSSARTAEIFHFQNQLPRVLNASMQSRVFDTLLALVDARTGRLVAVDDDSLDGVNALLLRSLEPGDYYLIATIAGTGAGAYTLQARLDPPRICETRDLRAGDSTSGQLTEADCRFLDLVANDDTENRMEVYQVRIADPGVLTMEVNSSNFPAAVVLFDASGKLLNSASSGRVNQAARFGISLNPGTYRVGATHAQLAAGSYQLRTTFEALRTCEPEALAPDAAAGGTLSTSGCRFQDFVALSTDGASAKPYKLTVEKRASVTIDMTSAQVDSYLFVLDAENRALAEDDNSGGGRNARLTMTLNPGAYTLLANTATAQSGPFEIKTAFLEPRECPANELTFTEAATAQLTAEDCATRDVMSESGRSTPARFHIVKLTEPGTVSIDVTTAAFLPSLILVDSAGRRIASDEPAVDAYLGAAHIRRALPAGTYGVVVTATAGRAGEYTLRAGFRR